jgi:hypothetical protein
VNLVPENLCEKEPGPKRDENRFQGIFPNIFFALLLIIPDFLLGFSKRLFREFLILGRLIDSITLKLIGVLANESLIFLLRLQRRFPKLPRFFSCREP